MKKKWQKRKGFLLLEVLFGISIFVIVAIAITLFARNIWIYGAYISTGLSDANDGKNALKTIVKEIRTASAADTGAYVISLAASDTFTFYSDIDSDGLKEKVRYFLSGSEVKKGVIKPSGSPLSYNPGSEAISTLISSVINTDIFEYYDKNYDGTTDPLTTPIDMPSVRLVKITISIDKDPNRAPEATTFSTQVSIRNLKDNL